MKCMKNPDLKIDYKNKTFLYQGYFYGYVENQTIFLFWLGGSDVIPIPRCKRCLYYDYDPYDIRVYMDIRMSFNCIGVSISNYGYYPDVCLNTDSEMNEFIDFINWCFLNV